MIFQEQIQNHRLKPFNLDNRKKTLNPRLDQKESNTGDNPLRALSVNADEGGFLEGFPWRFASGGYGQLWLWWKQRDLNLVTGMKAVFGGGFSHYKRDKDGFRVFDFW
ncbi:hypothetical protein BDE02_10G133100 [Populus trichocarpa]|nr:hypothetical protein BDE02_10G133100 [Populus trichocarpa]KAI5574242.1 hypothetical protein BDE02_10G133100 [Populus trichocarpa]